LQFTQLPTEINPIPTTIPPDLLQQLAVISTFESSSARRAAITVLATSALAFPGDSAPSAIASSVPDEPTALPLSASRQTAAVDSALRRLTAVRSPSRRDLARLVTPPMNSSSTPDALSLLRSTRSRRKIAEWLSPTAHDAALGEMDDQ
jgi:hypothetical protein